MHTKTETVATAEFRQYIKRDEIFMKSPNSSLKTRVITCAVAVPLLILVLLSPKYILIPVVMAASLVALFEYFKAVGLTEHPLLCIMGYIASLVISVGAEFSTATSISLVYVFMIAVFVVMLIKHPQITVKHIGLLIFGLFYIPYFLSHITYTRSLEYGNIYIWLIFLGACCSDTFAYFAGSYLGKHKLCPTISPKKTVEGAIGGVLGSGLVFMGFGFLINAFSSQLLDGKHMNIWLLLALGIVAAIISEIGDLVASAVKRHFDIKDFGNLLPGHGGLLDRLDSIILVAPLVFLFVYNIPLIN